MQRSSARLAVVPTLESPDHARLVGTIRLLEREGALSVRTLVACVWTDDGAIRTTAALPDDGDESAFLAGLLTAVFRTTVVDEDGRPADFLLLSDRDLSPAFVSELRQNVVRGTPFVAMIVDLLHATEVAHELWRLPGSRLIYGVVPHRPDRPGLALQS